MLSRFHLIPKRHGRTDRQTDGQNCYIISRVSSLTRDNKTGQCLHGGLESLDTPFCQTLRHGIQLQTSVN